MKIARCKEWKESSSSIESSGSPQNAIEDHIDNTNSSERDILHATADEQWRRDDELEDFVPITPRKRKLQKSNLQYEERNDSTPRRRKDDEDDNPSKTPRAMRGRKHGQEQSGKSSVDKRHADSGADPAFSVSNLKGESFTLQNDAKPVLDAFDKVNQWLCGDSLPSIEEMEQSGVLSQTDNYTTIVADDVDSHDPSGITSITPTDSISENGSSTPDREGRNHADMEFLLSLLNNMGIRIMEVDTAVFDDLVVRGVAHKPDVNA